MNNWNLAQEWFITAFTGGAGTPFLLYETNATFDSMVTITFNQTQTMQDLGETHWYAFHDQQGSFKKVIVTISLDLTEQDGGVLSDSELLTIATHELGHALGLNHTTFSTSDLMNHVPKVMFPSTLNLYAVYLLSQSTNQNDLPQQAVTLPDRIPYMMVSQDELNTVTPTTVQSATTSSLQLTQLITAMPYRPWSYVGLSIVFAMAVVPLAMRRRRRAAKMTAVEKAEVTFHDDPVAESEPFSQEPVKKKCSYCRAEVRPEDSICRECGMPAMYRK